MKRKMIGVLLSAAMLAGILSGCSKASDAKDGPAAPAETADAQGEQAKQEEQSAPAKSGGVTITVGLKASHVEISNIETYKKGWEEQSGNTVDIQAIDDDQFDSLLQTKMSTSGMWDIFIGDTGTQSLSYQHENNLVDLSAEPWTENLTDAAKDFLNYMASNENIKLNLDTRACTSVWKTVDATNLSVTLQDTQKYVDEGRTEIHYNQSYIITPSDDANSAFLSILLGQKSPEECAKIWSDSVITVGKQLGFDGFK